MRRALASIVLVAAVAHGAELPAIVEAVKPSLVVVGYAKPGESTAFTVHGAGFAVGDGSLVVTNAHVVVAPVDPAAQLTVQVRGRGGALLEAREATVVEVDAAHDLALLRIAGRPLPALAVRGSAAAREGQAVALMGFPVGGLLGYAPVTHRGIVSSIAPIALPGPNPKPPGSGAFDVLQLDVNAYPGNDGGPLFDAATGEVLGVVDTVFLRDTREATLARPTGIGYAIPASHVAALLRRHAAAR